MCKAISRRAFISGSSAILLAMTTSTNKANAQQYRLLCSYAGGSFGQGLAQPTRQAVDELTAIQRALDYHAPLLIFQGGVGNASATILNGQPVIIYNPDFLGSLVRCNRIAAITVLAHEVGHHANQDTTWSAQFRHPWSRELGADYVSGVAMKRLRISLQDAQSGIICGFGPFSPGSPSHPDSQRRLQAITDGWYAG